MHNVLKRTRKKNGITVRSKNFYLRYRYGLMPSSKYKPLGVSCKEAAWQKANEFKREYEAEMAGLLPPRSVREAENKSIQSHVEDYLSDLKARGRDGRKGKGAKQIRKRLLRLIRECGWSSLGKITPDSFTQWRARLNEMSSRTKNHYLAEVKTFLNWMILQGRMAINPLASVAKVDQTVATRVRRALTNEELAKLFEYSPHYRRVPYLMSARTGLRYGELSELVWGDVVLDGENSHVLVRASISKNKKEARIPLIAELEQLLAEFKPEGAMPKDRVFKDGVPRCVTLKKDLKAAGIPYIDESGRYADFHALRYTFNTWLQTNGVPPRMAQELMRHSDRRLTDQVYLDTTLLPLQECMRSIEGFGPLTQILTHFSGKTCHLGSRVGETSEKVEIAGRPLTVGFGRSLTQPDEICEWRDRRDSNPRPPA